MAKGKELITGFTWQISKSRWSQSLTKEQAAFFLLDSHLTGRRHSFISMHQHRTHVPPPLSSAGSHSPSQTVTCPSADSTDARVITVTDIKDNAVRKLV